MKKYIACHDSGECIYRNVRETGHIKMIVSCPECSARFVLDATALGGAGRLVRCGKCTHTWHQKQDTAGPDPGPDPGPDGTTAAAPPPEPNPEPDPEPDPEPNPEPEPAAADAAGETATAQNQDPGEDFEETPELSAARLRAAERPGGAKLPSPFRRRRYWPMRLAWATLVLVLIVLIGGGMAYRDEVIAIWPAAEPFYEAIGLGREPLGAGLSLVDVKFAEKKDGGTKVLTVEGQIRNISNAVRRIPGMRATLFDDGDKELQRWTFAPPVARLLPSERVTFHTRVENPAAGAVRLTIDFYRAKTP